MVTIIREDVIFFGFGLDELITIKKLSKDKYILDKKDLKINSDNNFFIYDNKLVLFPYQDEIVYIYNLANSKMERVIRDVIFYIESIEGFYFSKDIKRSFFYRDENYKYYKYFDLKKNQIQDTSAIDGAEYIFKNARLNFGLVKNKYGEISDILNNWTYKIYHPDKKVKIIAVIDNTLFVLTDHLFIVGIDVKSGTELFKNKMERDRDVDGVTITYFDGIRNAKVDKINKRIVAPFIQIDMDGSIYYTETYPELMPDLDERGRKLTGWVNMRVFEFTKDIMVFSMLKEKLLLTNYKSSAGEYLYILNRKDDSLIKEFELSKKSLLGTRQISIQKDAIYILSTNLELRKIDFDINDYDLSI